MKQSPELRVLIAEYFEAFTAGGPEWVDGHVVNSPELRLIGTNASEWLEGEQAFAVFRQEASEAAGTLGAEVTEIEAYSEGDVGWGAALVRFTIPTGETARSRFSVVFVMRSGDWKVVSAHNSIAVSDDDAFAID
ncbi:MAG: nuclear transport factor 2 family protein [Acidimicrobiales bacterium]